jgi:HEXXH motif-containing protein
LLTTHRLSDAAFVSLASGGGDPTVIGDLLAAQHSKHVMLLHVIAQAAREADPASPAAAAFLNGYRLLTTIQEADPNVVASFLGLPHVGAWAHDCLDSLDQGLEPDFGYLALVAAAAAVRSGTGFELSVPAQDGQVHLPSLGCLDDVGQDAWVLLRCDGKHLNVGSFVTATCADLVPDDGSGWDAEHWRGTPLIRAVAEGHAWEVLLETADRHLDRYALPMATMTRHELSVWRDRIQSAWKLLVQHHCWASGPVAQGVSVIVPMTARNDAAMDSATAPTAFGSIASSLPPDPVIMAETLVHEFAHLKLCGVMDLKSLIGPYDKRVYAPWRPDPRPVGGLLQGVYAHLGIVRFWEAQRAVETEPDGMFRAELMYERWRLTIEPCIDTLLKTGCLTAEGIRFVETLRDASKSLETSPVPAAVSRAATETALDHWLTWQLRHVAIDADEVLSLADAFHRDEQLHDQLVPQQRIVEGTRKINSTALSRLVSMRYLEPHVRTGAPTSEVSYVSRADALLFDGQTEAAIQAYQEEILAVDEPLPAAWIGLGLAVHRLVSTPLRRAFNSHLPLIFDVYACLRSQGIRSDPLDLAAWFA